MSTSELRSIIKYFPTGTAEAETDFLAKAFIPPLDYVDIITPPARSPRLLVGQKGSGKTAFLRVLGERAAASGMEALYIKPDDMDAELMEGKDSLSALKKQAYSLLVQVVAIQIGSRLSGLLSEEDSVLLRAAIKSGELDRDAVQKAMTALAKFGTAVTDLKLEKLLPDDSKAPDEKILRAIRGNLSATERVFYLLIDDTDQIAVGEVSGRQYLNSIWALLLAARKMCEKVPNVRCVISIRSEIWSRLKWSNLGQRDQLDHFVRLVYELRPSTRQIERMLDRRLNMARDHARPGEGIHAYQLFFKGRRMRLPGAVEGESKRRRPRRPWKGFVMKWSRKRPRDVIQLVGALAAYALNQVDPQITEEHADKVATEFSEERAGYLAVEYGPDCPEIEAVLRAFSVFSGEDFRVAANQLRQHLVAYLASHKVHLRGEDVSGAKGRKDAWMDLWRLLYESAFLNARVPDDRMPDEYNHVEFSDDPTLVSMGRWPEVSGAMWEVHPAFRRWLYEIAREEQHRDGAGQTGLVGKKKRTRTL